jgi:hypothetical protein
MRLQSSLYRTAIIAGLATSALTTGLLGTSTTAQAEPLDSELLVTASATLGQLTPYAVDERSMGTQSTEQLVVPASSPTFAENATTFQVNQPIALAPFTAGLIDAGVASDAQPQPSLDVASQVQLPTMDIASADLKQLQDATASSSPDYGFSYIGGGINIGLGSGRTGLGQTSFAIVSKLGLTDYLSFRPSILFTDNLTVLLPVTYDFRGRRVAGTTVLPFLGAGVAAATRNGTSFELLLTAGVDVPISKEITVTGSLNATITGGSSIGLLLGVAYNFE